MDSRIHIVHINFVITIGGIDSMLIDIVNEQIKYAKVTLLIINNRIDDLIINNLDKEVTLIKINKKEGSFNLFKIIKLNFQLYKLKPSIIHCHNSNIAKLIVSVNCPKVLTVHDIGYNTKQYNKFQKIFAISKAVFQDINSKGNFPVSIIYNGVNPKGILQQITNSNNEIFKLVLISRLEHEKKGHDLLLQAIKNCFDDNHTIKLHADFIGEGKSEKYLKNLVKEYDLENNVSFLGKKSRNYVYENLKEYDLLIQPSRYEGFGLTVVEGMLAKIPVLVSAIDGPLEIIKNGEYGYSFESNNIKDLTKKLLNLIVMIKENNSTFKTKLENSYKYANSTFTIEQTAKGYFNEYLKLLQ